MDKLIWRPNQGIQDKVDFLDSIGSNQFRKFIRRGYLFSVI